MIKKIIWALILIRCRINLFAKFGSHKLKLSKRLTRYEWNWIKKVNYEVYKYLKDSSEIG